MTIEEQKEQEEKLIIELYNIINSDGRKYNECNDELCDDIYCNLHNSLITYIKENNLFLTIKV